ncbi:MAG TPA: hypothetical protein VGS16_06225 [Candidatus Dormibacteraeota bacterium]|nr:hypothetical protein [Candidatus Dormibacteraeota bacterium]
MSKRLIVVSGVAAALMVLGGQVVASANVMWCVSDPPILVVTPGGHNLTVNNMIYLAPEDLHIAKQITDDATVAPDGRGGTLITVHVYLPAASHGGHVVSNNFRYRVSDSNSAQGGGAVLTLLLDVPTS